MYKIKQIPEDFIVNEISSLDISNDGDYAYFELNKTSHNTVGALQVLSKTFKIPLKFFGFAGNKDKDAVTSQKISILKGSKKFENYEFRNMSLKYLGNGKNPISLGDLEGNEFVITIRQLSENEIKKLQNIENKKITIPNLFGPQRFSKNNHLVGKALIKKEFKGAVDLILENNGTTEGQIRSSLEENKNNYVHALRLIPLKIRKLFIHSYQSFLFNKISKELIQNGFKENIEISLMGFGFEIDSIKDKNLRSIYKKIIDDEKISSRDFIIPQMPELTSEGSMRKIFMETTFKIVEISEDEFNDGMKAKIKFFLPKSSYATVAIEFILS